jgi:hypothetical protein
MSHVDLNEWSLFCFAMSGIVPPAKAAVHEVPLFSGVLGANHKRVYPKVSGLAAWNEICK